MRDLMLVKGDLTFEMDDLALVEGPDELRQTVYIGLQTNQGEWFDDPEIGIDFNVLLGKKPNIEEIRGEIMRGIYQDSRIQTVDDLTITPDTKARVIHIKFTATATDGTTIEREVDISA